MADLNYYLGPWHRDTEQNAWVPPSGTVGLLDFGSLNDCALSPSAIDQRGIGLFCTPRAVTLPSEYDLLDSGDCREIQVTDAHRNIVEAALGVRIDAVGMTLAQAAAALYGAGDPTGLARWKPLTPTREGAYEIHLGGHSQIFSRKFDGPADKTWNKLRDLLRHDLQKHDDECKSDAARLRLEAKDLRKNGTGDKVEREKIAAAKELHADKIEFHAERVLDAMCVKYRCLPTELSTTIRRGRAQTTISDNFSSSLTGWTVIDGTWATRDVGSGNYRLYKSDGGYADKFVRYDTPLSASDYYATLDCYSNEGGGAYAGPAMRLSSGVNCYWASFTASYVKCDKYVSGSKTNLGQVFGQSWTSGTTHRGECSGSTITAIYKTADNDYTDTAHASGLYCGAGTYLPGSYQSTEFDTFYATDGIAAGNPYYAYAQQQ